MRFRITNRPDLFSASMVAAALTLGLAFAQQAGAAPAPGMGGGMHGKGMHAGGHGKQCACGLKQSGRHGGGHLFGPRWKDTLSAEQQARLDQLHLNFAKSRAPLKARIKALKLDLAVLSVAPQPDKSVIDAKIAELMELKGQALGAEYGYTAAKRQVLTPEQQVSFDMETIHKAMHGKRGKRHRCGH